MLGNDIELNDYSVFTFDTDFEITSVSVDADNWVPLGTQANPFTGHLDGNGFTVRGLYSKAENAGLFGFAEDATIKDMNVYLSYVCADNLGGLVCAGALGTTVISDVCVSGTCTSDGTDIVSNRLGSVAGLLEEEAKITDCCSYADVSAKGGLITSAGGIVGNNNGIVEKCAFDGSVSVADSAMYAYAGGIAGFSEGGKVALCKSGGNVSAVSGSNTDEVYCGGIVARAFDGTVIENCTGSCDFSLNCQVTSALGGIVGEAINSSISKCENLSDISVTADYVGGIAGSVIADNALCSIEDCYNKADITGTGVAGGIVGTGASIRTYSSLLHIKNNLNIGSVSAECHGGVIGFLQTTEVARKDVLYCYTIISSADETEGVETLGTSSIQSSTNPDGLSEDVWSFASSRNPVLVYSGTMAKNTVLDVEISQDAIVDVNGNTVNVEDGNEKCSYIVVDDNNIDTGKSLVVIWFGRDEEAFVSKPQLTEIYIINSVEETQACYYDYDTKKLGLYMPESMESCTFVASVIGSEGFERAYFIQVTASGLTEHSFNMPVRSGCVVRVFAVDSTSTLTPLGTVVEFNCDTGAVTFLDCASLWS